MKSNLAELEKSIMDMLAEHRAELAKWIERKDASNAQGSVNQFNHALGVCDQLNCTIARLEEILE